MSIYTEGLFGVHLSSGWESKSTHRPTACRFSSCELGEPGTCRSCGEFLSEKGPEPGERGSLIMKADRRKATFLLEQLHVHFHCWKSEQLQRSKRRKTRMEAPSGRRAAWFRRMKSMHRNLGFDARRNDAGDGQLRAADPPRQRSPAEGEGRQQRNRAEDVSREPRARTARGGLGGLLDVDGVVWDRKDTFVIVIIIMCLNNQIGAYGSSWGRQCRQREQAETVWMFALSAG